MISKRVTTCMIVSGALLAVITAVIMGCSRVIYNSIVNSVVELGDGKTIMDSFVTPPVPIYLNFYMFNVTNPTEVQYYGEIPVLKEIGPYVYEEVREKFDLNFVDDGNSVQYYQNKTYFFREDLTGTLKESDRVTTVNPVMVVLAAMSEEYPQIKCIWPEIEGTMNVFESYNISEMLFEGFELPAFNFNFSLSGIPAYENITLQGTLYEILLELGVDDEKINDVIKGNKIGYYSTLNHTDDGLFKVSTGKADIEKYVEILEWENYTSLPFWSGEYCNQISGTDGTMYPPRTLSDSPILWIFVTELCRSLYLNYESSFKYYDVSILRFTPSPELLQSPAINEENMCFVGPMGILASSLLEMTPCLEIPVVMSTPHFYQGDGDELAKYEGLSPEKEKHETFLDVEPTFGVPLRAHKRIQVNLPLKKYGYLPSFMNFQDVYYFPVMWADETAELNEEDTNAVHTALTLPFTLVYSIGSSLLVVALLLLGFGFYHKKKSIPV